MSEEVRPHLPRRAIHLDFHTGPAIPDVAREFDAVSFAGPFRAAQVDSVTVFAKCHHGHLYLDTDHDARHPNLPDGLDLLGEQVEALHAAGIAAPIYISIQCDEYAADTHPEWVAIAPDGRQVKWAPDALTPGWQILDMSSPYQDYVAEQLDLVLRRLEPVDGVFLDMCWDQPSVSRWALDGMRRRGLDPTDAAQRARYAREVAHGYMARFGEMIRGAQKEAAPASIFFNSRPRALALDERDLTTHVEIEALPTGGWGYAYTPYVGRLVRSFDLPAFGMTARFHRSWGDNTGLKPAAALRYECCQLLSLGMGASIGDVLHPRGTTSPAAYELIGDTYAHLAACEPHLEGTVRVTEVAVLVDLAIDPAQTAVRGPDAAQSGAVRALQQLRHQFDIVTPASDLSGYRVVIVPESTELGPAEVDALRAYVHGGGKVVLVGRAGLVDGGPLLAEQGVDVEGPSPFSHIFVRMSDARSEVTDPPDAVVYERGVRVRPTGEATPLAMVVEPYFERTWEHFCGHDYTPPDRSTSYAAVVRNGGVVTIAYPLLEAFAKHAAPSDRDLLGLVLDQLMPDPVLRAGGPEHLETAVAQTKGRTVVHLLSFLASRRGDDLDLVTDPFPLVDVPVALRSEAPPDAVVLEPAGQPLPFEHRDGYVHTRATVLDGHALIVITP